ncbi:MAG: PAS domain-containing protein, partial [Candidatus Kapabacteria bacterium]|nr:PAS domain-containing protein [Candidatus Kapabacteria bacterium]
MNKITDLKMFPAMAHSIDANDCLLSVSDIWLNKFGYTEAEVIGKNSIDFLTESSKKYATEIVLPEFYKVGYCTDIEYQFVKKDGSIIETLLSARVQKDISGNHIGTIAIITDITLKDETEKKLIENNKKLEDSNKALLQAKTKAEESELNLRLLLESSEDMITIHDLNGTYLNYFGPEKYSLKPIDIVGKKIEDFLSKENADLLNKQIIETSISGLSA